MKTVLVLLSAYNGEKYIEEQIDSILKQKGIRVQILVRDDGSSDSTPEILRRYSEKYDNVWVKTEPNIGCKKSFYTLLKYAAEMHAKFDYYAFSDQDDYWGEFKLYNATLDLETKAQNGKCILYHSAYEVVDQNLNHLSYHNNLGEANLGAALVRGSSIGCSMVFNKLLLDESSLINEIALDNEYLPYHDLWVFLVACAFDGIIVASLDHSLKYRQHGDNVVGLDDSVTKKYLRRFHNLKSSPGLKSGFSKLLLELYGDRISDENKYILSLCTTYKRNFFNRIKLLLSSKVKTSNKSVNMGLKVAILLGWF